MADKKRKTDLIQEFKDVFTKPSAFASADASGKFGDSKGKISPKKGKLRR